MVVDPIYRIALKGDSALRALRAMSRSLYEYTWN